MIASLIMPAAVVAAFCADGATASGSSYFTGAGLKGKVSPGTLVYGGAYYGPYYSGDAVAPVRHSDCGPLGVCESCDHYGHVRSSRRHFCLRALDPGTAVPLRCGPTLTVCVSAEVH